MFWELTQFVVGHLSHLSNAKIYEIRDIDVEVIKKIGNQDRARVYLNILIHKLCLDITVRWGGSSRVPQYISIWEVLIKFADDMNFLAMSTTEEQSVETICHNLNTIEQTARDCIKASGRSFGLPKCSWCYSTPLYNNKIRDEYSKARLFRDT